jgi:hypothetical protein
MMRTWLISGSVSGVLGRSGPLAVARSLRPVVVRGQHLVDLRVQPGADGQGEPRQGPGVPHAIAAKFASRAASRLPWSATPRCRCTGSTNCSRSRATWREWSDPRLIVLVLDNGARHQVTWDQRR